MKTGWRKKNKIKPVKKKGNILLFIKSSKKMYIGVHSLTEKAN